MMPMEDCVNCRKERSTLNTLQYSQLPFNVEGLGVLMEKDLTFETILNDLQKLKSSQIRKTALFLHIHHQTGRNINDEDYSLEQAAQDILDKNISLYQSCEKYLKNSLDNKP
tara:strand:- start:26259 stop:26594 length:336 start_codon:yes stop_codon:yes gene_type:complete